MTSVQLIKTPSVEETVLADKWYLPLELVWIGTYVREFGHDIEILDGQQLDLETIKSRISAPIIGIGFQSCSSGHLDELVRAAKDRGALVVVGGQAATPLAEQLLNGNERIDAVVCYDGEEAMRRIADTHDRGQDPFAGTPNVVYRRNGRIVRGSVQEVPVTSVPIPDRQLDGIEIEQYISNFQTTNTFVAFDGKRATNAHTKKGCPRRCSFCGRMDKHHRTRSAQQVFDEYRYLVECFGVDYIFDHSDTWALNAAWLEEFRAVYQREGGLDVRLAIFGDLRDLTPVVIENLKVIGVDAVEIGIESGHEGVLVENGKGIRCEEIELRVKALTDAGIKVEASYVLGILGETPASVRETVELSRRLRERAQGLLRNYFNIISPLPGTLLWQRLLSDPIMEEKYGSDYTFDQEELCRDSVQRLCNLGPGGYEFLLEERNNILAENGLPVLNYER